MSAPGERALGSGERGRALDLICLRGLERELKEISRVLAGTGSEGRSCGFRASEFAKADLGRGSALVRAASRLLRELY